MSLSQTRVIKSATACLVVGACFLLAGCKEKTPEPSGSGYYDGPMKPKVGAGGSQPANAANPSTKPGTP